MKISEKIWLIINKKFDPIALFETVFFFTFLSVDGKEFAEFTVLITSVPLCVHTFFMHYWCIFPEVFLLLLIIFLILKKKIKLVSFIQFSMMSLFAIFLHWLLIFFTTKWTPVRFFFSEYYFFDKYIFLIKLFFFGIFLLFITIIHYRFFYRKIFYGKREVEFYRIVLILFLSFWLFSFLLISSNNLFGFYFILEGLSFILIFSCVLNFNKAFCLMTSIRYFTLNAFASGCILFGIIILYGALKTTNLFYIRELLPIHHKSLMFPDSPRLEGNYIDILKTRNRYYWARTYSEKEALIFFHDHPHRGFVPLSIIALFLPFFLLGCFFKLGCFPFNWWILSINTFISYETYFLFNILFKNIFFFFFFRLFTYYFSVFSFAWTPMFLFIGFSTVVIGSLCLFSQKQIKGFFTFSSMIQIGYTIIGMSLTTVEVNASVFFLHIIYILNSVLIFSILLYFSSDIKTQYSSKKQRNIFFALSDLHLLRFINPTVAIVFTIAILSFAGLPPTLGFFAKYYYFETLFQAGLYKLCIALFILNTISLYPYINLLKNLWLFNRVNNFQYVSLPIFGYENFMMYILYGFISINYLSIFLYSLLLNWSRQLSFYGSSFIFGQWFISDENLFPSLTERWNKNLERIQNFQQTNPALKHYAGFECYGPGVNNSVARWQRHEDLWHVYYLKTFWHEWRIHLDNFSDEFVLSYGLFIELLAIVVFGLFFLVIMLLMFYFCYVKELYIGKQVEVYYDIKLTWFTFGQKHWLVVVRYY